MRPSDVEPEVAEALRTVLSSGQPQRFKVLTVVCVNDHTLGHVYRTAAGLVLVHATEGEKRERSVDVPGIGQVPAGAVPGPRAQTVGYRLRENERVRFPMQCRCATHTPYAHELLATIEAGKKRHRLT